MKILTDTHAHTVASTHAYSTIHDHLAAAKEQNLQMFAITDHGSAMPDSPHDWHFGNMRVIPRVIDNIAILRGIEANILSTRGNTDIPPFEHILDIVIASLHPPVLRPSTKGANTKAIINTIKSGKCQIIGHPGNPHYPIKVDDVVKAARDYNVLLEINNSSFSLSRAGSEKNCRHILERVAHYNWKVSFASDAHISYHLGKFPHCLQLAASIGFPKENIVSSTPAKLLNFLKEHGKTVHTELADWLNGLPQS